MNLGIEYLVRTGTIRNFLQAPCSLFLEKETDQEYVVLCLKKVPDRPSVLNVQQWWLCHSGEDGLLPRLESYFVSRDEVFFSPHTILPDFLPLPYLEEPIVTSTNAYNHPMSREEWSHFSFLYLNSNKHNSSRLDWLWKAFVRKHFSILLVEDHMCLGFWDRLEAIQKEQRFVKSRYHHRWLQWVLWKSEFAIRQEAATELIFWSAYRPMPSASL